MRAFSELNLIDKELEKGFIGKLFVPTNVTLKLLIPKELYFRANILCEDVSSSTGERFKLSNLIELLWNDFLEDVIEHQKIKEIYKLLLDYDRGTPNVRLSHYQRNNVEEVPLYPIRKPFGETETFYCKMKRKLVLRGEVMLSDISTVYPQHPFSFERVLEILLIDFLIKYQKGEAASIIESIMFEETS